MVMMAELAIRGPEKIQPRVDWQGLEIIEEMRRNNEKVIFLVPHGWAVDIPAMLMASQGQKMAAMFHNQGNKVFDYVWNGEGSPAAVVEKHGLKQVTDTGAIEKALDELIDLLNPGGRFCIITFHSLEDRIVKNAFRRNENPCTCPPEFPVCVCGNVPIVKVTTRKPLVATAEEVERNPRARSAKIRCAERL